MAFYTCASYRSVIATLVLPPVGTWYTFVVGPIRTYRVCLLLCTYEHLFLLPFGRVDVFIDRLIRTYRILVYQR